MRDDDPLDSPSSAALHPRATHLRATQTRARAALGPSSLEIALAFAAVYLIWGSTYLGIRVAVRSLPPFLMAGTRYGSAGALLYGVLRWRGARAPTRIEWQRAAFAGVLLLSLGNGLVTWAETHVPSNLAALSIAAVPSYVALMDWLRPGGTRPPRRVLGGVALGALGMLLLLRPDPNTIGADRWLPLVALVLAGAAWASGSLYTRYQKLHPNAALAGAQQMLVGGAVLVVLGALRGELRAVHLNTVSGLSVLAFGYLTLFGSIVAFSAFNWLIGVVSPARVSTSAYVNPVVAVLLGWLILGEPLSPVSLTGGGLILCAVIVMTVRRSPARS
jgi:drug/metabolite transporter (DMT)-like permease